MKQKANLVYLSACALLCCAACTSQTDPDAGVEGSPATKTLKVTVHPTVTGSSSYPVARASPIEIEYANTVFKQCKIDHGINVNVNATQLSEPVDIPVKDASGQNTKLGRFFFATGENFDTISNYQKSELQGGDVFMTMEIYDPETRAQVPGVYRLGTNVSVVRAYDSPVNRGYARTIAHEIGHILGLGHVSAPDSSLMLQAANGTYLSRDECDRASTSTRLTSP